ncbi:MAG TPA: DUF5662 family protein [Phycisphaerae bacterium]|nr:DUF5662 family protein [Phycisphaerae bacterium]
MKRHLAYLWYVLRHKWFVGVECFRRGMIWRGIKHDWSKFLPSEWFPYARHFYNRDGSKIGVRDKTGYYKPTDTGDAAFDFAWLLHQKRNRHHWQWWCLPEDVSGLKVLMMNSWDVLEMVCDWTGAALAQGHGRDVQPWYEANKTKMQMHPATRAMVEAILTFEKAPHGAREKA